MSKATDIYEYVLMWGKTKRLATDTTMFTPTDATPGSPEKIEILRDRVSRGLPCFHPKDRVDYRLIRIKLTPTE